MDNNLIQTLKQGDFSSLALNEWFTNLNHDNFYYVNAAIEGCDKNINSDILNFILMYAKNIYLNTETLTSLDVSITKERCEQILKKIIIIGSKHVEYIDSLKELANFPNDIIRLHYCAYINHKEYLNDNSKRVRKVANIINNFYKQKLGEIYKNHNRIQLQFLTSAIKYGAIQLIDIITPHKNDEMICIRFKSMLFDWNNASINPNYMNFDVDILHTIPEKQILASIILDWIKDGTISFKENMTPECFKTETTPIETEIKEIINTPHKRTLKPNN